MFETFDHTADLGLRIRSADLNALFTEAGLALTSLLIEDVSTIRETQAVAIEFPPEDLDYLLFDWLKAILSHFDMDGLLLARFDVHVGPDGLKATAHGEPRDETRHELAHEVKAITYHGLKVEQADGGWLAEVIVDI